jgi:hypothetical protein
LTSGPIKAHDVKKEAKQAGIYDTPLRRAREKLGIKPKKSDFSGGWVWALPYEDALHSEDALLKRDSILGGKSIFGRVEIDANEESGETDSGAKNNGSEIDANKLFEDDSKGGVRGYMEH